VTLFFFRFFLFFFSISFGLFWMKQPDLLSSLRAWNYPLHFGVFCFCLYKTD
jgi:hypothetical protein